MHPAICPEQRLPVKKLHAIALVLVQKPIDPLMAGLVYSTPYEG